jgi:hypothetical protein
MTVRNTRLSIHRTIAVGLLLASLMTDYQPFIQQHGIRPIFQSRLCPVTATLTDIRASMRCSDIQVCTVRLQIGRFRNCLYLSASQVRASVPLDHFPMHRIVYRLPLQLWVACFLSDRTSSPPAHAICTNAEKTVDAYAV